MNSIIETDLQRYAADAGPEPEVDSAEPDMAAQYRVWRDWWWTWFQKPLRRGDEHGNG